VKDVYGEKLRTSDLSKQPVRGIKEIPKTGSCEPVESIHWSHVILTYAFSVPWTLLTIWLKAVDP